MDKSVKSPKNFPRSAIPTADDAGAADWATNAVDEYALAAETTNSEALEPQSLKEAQSQPDWKLWEKAIEEELATLKAAGTWKLVDAPEGVNVVGEEKPTRLNVTRGHIPWSLQVKPTSRSSCLSNSSTP